MKTSVVSALILACLPAASLAMDEHIFMQPDSLKWGAAPPSLPPGSEVAVLFGDPSGSGPYAVRVRMPANYKVPPHTHPTAENVTVLSGTLNVAMGNTADTTKGEALPADDQLFWDTARSQMPSWALFQRQNNFSR